VYPADVLNTDLVRRNGIATLAGMTMLVFLPAFAWCRENRPRVKGLYNWLVVLGYAYFGAAQGMDKEDWEEILNPRILA
jgi:hypothetical protein